jgi:hypothetical protein
MGVKLGVSHFKGKTEAGGVREWGEEEDNWTWDVGSKSRPDKSE